jgi:hypothetical protein
LQGYLADRGIDPKTHAARDAEIANPANGVPPKVYWAYRELKDRSERARYRLASFDPIWVQEKLIEGRLKTITEFVGL